MPTPTGPCDVCLAYAARRSSVISPEVHLRAFLRGVAPEVVGREFMHRVHARHVSGLSLSTTPGDVGV